MRRWTVVLLLWASVAWARPMATLYLDHQIVQVQSPKAQEVSVVFLTLEQKPLGTFTFTEGQWQQLVAACRTAAQPNPGVNQREIATVAGVRVWSMASPGTGQTLVLTAGRTTLAQVAESRKDQFLKVLTTF